MPKEEILTCNRRSAAAIATASTSELRSIILLCLFRNMKYDTRTARHAATDTAFVTITGTSDVSDGGQWSNSSSEAINVSFVVSAILSTNVGNLVKIGRREGREDGESPDPDRPTGWEYILRCTVAQNVQYSAPEGTGYELVRMEAGRRKTGKGEREVRGGV
jgi:hypothetical protein